MRGTACRPGSLRKSCYWRSLFGYYARWICRSISTTSTRRRIGIFACRRFRPLWSGGSPSANESCPRLGIQLRFPPDRGTAHSRDTCHRRSCRCTHFGHGRERCVCRRVGTCDSWVKCDIRCQPSANHLLRAVSLWVVVHIGSHPRACAGSRYIPPTGRIR